MDHDAHGGISELSVELSVSCEIGTYDGDIDGAGILVAPFSENLLTVIKSNKTFSM